MRRGSRLPDEIRYDQTYSIRLTGPQFDALHTTAIRERISTARLVRRQLGPIIDPDLVFKREGRGGESP